MAEIEWKDINQWVVEIKHSLEGVESSIGRVEESLGTVIRKLDDILQILKRIDTKTREGIERGRSPARQWKVE
ncbi:MAG TPA: hypothetical protein G4N93_01590 [Dehalococcoidia bacterium]|nr:hypothetical protein [Dehalococcoidia bacterium]